MNIKEGKDTTKEIQQSPVRIETKITENERTGGDIVTARTKGCFTSRLLGLSA